MFRFLRINDLARLLFQFLILLLSITYIILRKDIFQICLFSVFFELLDSLFLLFVSFLIFFLHPLNVLVSKFEDLTVISDLGFLICNLTREICNPCGHFSFRKQRLEVTEMVSHPSILVLATMAVVDSALVVIVLDRDQQIVLGGMKLADRN